MKIFSFLMVFSLVIFMAVDAHAQLFGPSADEIAAQVAAQIAAQGGNGNDSALIAAVLAAVQGNQQNTVTEADIANAVKDVFSEFQEPSTNNGGNFFTNAQSWFDSNHMLLAFFGFSLLLISVLGAMLFIVIIVIILMRVSGLKDKLQDSKHKETQFKNEISVLKSENGSLRDKLADISQAAFRIINDFMRESLSQWKRDTENEDHQEQRASQLDQMQQQLDMMRKDGNTTKK